MQKNPNKCKSDPYAVHPPPPVSQIVGVDFLLGGTDRIVVLAGSLDLPLLRGAARRPIGTVSHCHMLDESSQTYPRTPYENFHKRLFSLIHKVGGGGGGGATGLTDGRVQEPFSHYICRGE